MALWRDMHLKHAWNYVQHLVSGCFEFTRRFFPHILRFNLLILMDCRVYSRRVWVAATPFLTSSFSLVMSSAMYSMCSIWGNLSRSRFFWTGVASRGFHYRDVAEGNCVNALFSWLVYQFLGPDSVKVLGYCLPIDCFLYEIAFFFLGQFWSIKTWEVVSSKSVLPFCW